MSYLRAHRLVNGATCDKCKKTMSDENPGIMLESYCRQTGNYTKIFAHIECVQQLLFKVREQHVKQQLSRLS